MKKNQKKRGNGEGSVFKITARGGYDVWVTQYPVGYLQNGKRKYITRRSSTQKEAIAILQKFINEYCTDSYVEKTGATVYDIAEQYIEDAYRLNKLKPNSYLRKKGILVHINKHYIASMEIQTIREIDIKEFLIYLTDFSQSVIDKAYGLINCTFQRALRKKMIKYNFFEDKLEFGKPKSKKPTKKVRGFSIDDHQKLLSAISCEFEWLQKNQQMAYKYQMLLSLTTGMRMGEINALDKDLDIDFKNKIITIRRTLTRDINDKTIIGEETKTEAGDRTINMEMDKQIERILQEYINTYWEPNPENLLFWDTRKNGLFSTTQVNTMFKRLCQKYKINKGYNVNQHQLRHTFATRSIEAGMPANVLQKIMGHTDLKTTIEIYCDVFAEYEKKHTQKTYEYLKNNKLTIFDFLDKDKLSNNTVVAQ